jgi:hypothetical protein
MNTTPSLPSGPSAQIPNGLSITIFSPNIHPIFPRYANEARIVWNGPLQHEANAFLSECLDHYFGEGTECHFYNIDKKRRPLVSFVSKVVDIMMKCISKFPFMKANKG